MAVTTYKGQNLVLIQENGSEPTGSGGKIINDNFKKIDEALFSGTSAIVEYARNANYANTASYASYANYAYSCSHGSGGSGGVGGYASLPGYADPWYSYPYAENNSSWPISIWGSQTSTYVYSTGSGYSASGGASFACVPPFGPFSLRANMVFYRSADFQSAIFADVLIFGWNLEIASVKILHSYKIDGSDVEVTGHRSLYMPSSNPSISAEIVGGMLQFGAHDGTYDGTFFIHARVENTFPGTGDSGSFYSGAFSSYDSLAGSSS